MSPPPYRQEVERPVTAPHTHQQAFLVASEAATDYNRHRMWWCSLTDSRQTQSMHAWQKASASGGCLAAPHKREEAATSRTALQAWIQFG